MDPKKEEPFKVDYEMPIVKALDSGLPERSDIEKRVKVKPYLKAIQRLKMIGEEEGPMKKLKLFDDVNLLILECIDDFWRGIPVDKSNLIIAAEEMMPIYIYIVIKSKLIDLDAEINFI
jgi:hypothetical protein